MKIIAENNLFVIKSDYLNLVAQGKTLQHALDNLDKTIRCAVHISKKKGIEKCGNFQIKKK